MRTFGPNSAYVNELYYEYLKNPDAFDESWRAFFARYNPDPSLQIPPSQLETTGTQPAQNGDTPQQQPAPDVPATPAPAPATPSATAPDGARPLVSAALRIAQNMEQSLGVPTATSFREVPVKLLEENRTLINGYLKASDNGKLSYTHIIGWAVVQALKKFPALNNEYSLIDNRPHLIERPVVNLGLAIDLERPGGGRSLVVPSVKGAEGMDFVAFYDAYETLVRKARGGKLGPDDFAGTTITLTNPGTIGTVASVPRLMAGQGAIIATGSINYPAAYQGAEAGTLANLGISKVMEITSTYDHRIIQGAESGMFLAYVQELLTGADDFYGEIFRSLQIPYRPLSWQQDAHKLFSDDRYAMAATQQRVSTMINNYRVRGHLLAHLDPLGYQPEYHPDLDPARYGLTIWDFDRTFVTSGVAERRMDLRTILSVLRDTYTQRIGVEFMHIQDPEPKLWLRDEMETTRNRTEFTRDHKKNILRKLSQAEIFEKFLQTKYTGHKRFSLEGAETLIPMLSELVDGAADSGVHTLVIGMAHRGRLNTFATIVGKSPQQIFTEFEDVVDPESVLGSGDVKYHLGYKEYAVSASGHRMEIWVAPNPSHLEAIDPVIEGMARALQDHTAVENASAGNTHPCHLHIPVLIHGDAAFAGQGVVAETFNMSQLQGYATGGTIHVVIDNQIGFTASPRDTRSMRYATDVARMVQAPIFHVNGDDPESAAHVMRLASRFRTQYRRDVVVDLVCYRRHGHNETDEPGFTNPILYQKIKAQPSTRVVYTGRLLRNGTLTMQEVESMEEDFKSKLEDLLQQTKEKPAPALEGDPLAEQHINPVNTWGDPDTGAPPADLHAVLASLSAVPDGFIIHPKLAAQFARRAESARAGRIDWALAEALAFGTLLTDGTPVRMTGQDCQRGTFSQRHAVLHHQQTDARYIPLNHVRPGGQALLAIYDSPLSEYAVVGFEYGYSVASPQTLVCWEAQFGDFVNGAQIAIDQFIASGEDKWGQTSGLVLLLPHGFEGQGPEHSSARLERFLTLCAEDNMQVIQPTTPAQYFHALRRQMKRTVRKPLVVMTPKSLLRHPLVVSDLSELTSGTFRALLPAGPQADPAKVTRVLLCSGRIYYDLMAAVEQSGVSHVAVLRLEQLYPFPDALLRAELARFAGAGEVVWVQDEPRNMGAWTWVQEKALATLATGQALTFLGRPASGSPAAGSARRHAFEQAEILRRATED